MDFLLITAPFLYKRAFLWFCYNLHIVGGSLLFFPIKPMHVDKITDSFVFSIDNHKINQKKIQFEIIIGGKVSR